MPEDNVREVEAALYETLVPGKPQIKVAMLIVRTFTEEIPAENTIDSALERLVLREDIKLFGLNNRWRHSEIKRI